MTTQWQPEVTWTTTKLNKLADLLAQPRELEAINDLIDTLRSALTLLEGAQTAMDLNFDSGHPITPRQKLAAADACEPIVDALRRAVPLFRAPRFTVASVRHDVWGGLPHWRFSVNDGAEQVAEFGDEAEADDYARQLNGDLPL